MSGAKYHNPKDPALKRVSQLMSRGELEGLRPEISGSYDEAHAAFPVRITRSFADRIDWNDVDDPLAKQVLPHGDELVHSQAGGLEDPVGDSRCSPVPWVIQKYSDRVLVMLTKHCHLHCRYCFRRTYTPSTQAEPSAAEWDDVLAYLKSVRPEEVILSGGDPLALSNKRLLSRLIDVRPFCQTIRIHSRAPITSPSRLTDSLCEALGEIDGLWLIVHTNHPRELSSEVVEGLRRLTRQGVPSLNQSVLLRGVNDDPEILATLCQLLLKHRVKPYYLHHPDRVKGADHFWVEPERGLEIYREMSRRISGMARPRYVIDPPDGSGKVPVSEWILSKEISVLS